VRPEGKQIKNFNDNVGNRTRDLTAYSAVPQLTEQQHELFSNFSDNYDVRLETVLTHTTSGRRLRDAFTENTRIHHCLEYERLNTEDKTWSG
jgi:hypothetical protein